MCQEFFDKEKPTVAAAGDSVMQLDEQIVNLNGYNCKPHWYKYQ